MTNITAVIIITISTNWIATGTFTPIDGVPEEVQVGNLVTNSTAIIEWKGARHETVLESINGPTCGERRIPKPSYPVQFNTNFFAPPRGIIYMTNLPTYNYQLMR